MAERGKILFGICHASLKMSFLRWIVEFVNPINYIGATIRNMGRRIKNEHRIAFEALIESNLYTAQDVACLAPFEGATAEKQKLNFYKNLTGHYRKLLGDPDDHVSRHGDSLTAAWFGSSWRKAVLGEGGSS